MFLMWLGEQITSRGIGNGISLIIFAGIVAESSVGACRHARTRPPGRAVDPDHPRRVCVMAVAVIAFIVFVERAQRRILIQYPKRQVSATKMSGGESSHLPLKLNTSGVIPPIFASSLLLLPTTAAGFAAAGGPEWLTTITTFSVMAVRFTCSCMWR